MTRSSVALTLVLVAMLVALVQAGQFTDVPFAVNTEAVTTEDTLTTAAAIAGEGNVLKNIGAASEENSTSTEDEAEGGEVGRPLTKNEKKRNLTGGQIALYLFADFILLCFAALFAGLTLSVMGLDTLSLEIIASSGQEPDRTYAKKILPIRKMGNQLLCTLILGNVMVNTLVAQITDKVFVGWVSTLMSTVLITLGGEIIPQATMSAHALYVGSHSAPVVKFFLILFYPICKPLAMFLNFVVGQDPGQIYERNELKRLMITHAKDHGKESGLGEHELGMMMGAMEIHEKTVVDVMTPIHKVFMLEANTILNEATLSSIWESGRSRIPIFQAPNRSDTVGILFAKDLIGVDPAEETKAITLVNFYNRTQHFVPEETKLVSVLKYFQSGKSHMALIKGIQPGVYYKKDPVYELLGIVTLEDVIEEFIHGEIFDEHDTTEKDKASGGTPGENQAVPALEGEAKAKELEMLLSLMMQLPGHPTQGGISGSLLGGGATAGGTTLIGAVRYGSWESGYQHKSTAMYLHDENPFFQNWPSQDHVTELLRTDLSESAVGASSPMSMLSSRIWEVRPRSNASSLKLGDKKNIWLYREGQQSNCVMVIVSGKVEVIIKQKKQREPQATQDVRPSSSIKGGASAKSAPPSNKNVSFAGSLGVRATAPPPLVEPDTPTPELQERDADVEEFVVELGPNSVVGTAGLDPTQQEKCTVALPAVEGAPSGPTGYSMTVFTPQYSCRAITSVKYLSFTLDAYNHFMAASVPE